MALDKAYRPWIVSFAAELRVLIFDFYRNDM